MFRRLPLDLIWEAITVVRIDRLLRSATFCLWLIRFGAHSFRFFLTAPFSWRLLTSEKDPLLLKASRRRSTVMKDLVISYSKTLAVISDCRRRNGRSTESRVAARIGRKTSPDVAISGCNPVAVAFLSK